MTKFTCSSIIGYMIDTNVSQKLPPELPAVIVIAKCEMPSPLQCTPIKEQPEAKVGQPILV